MAASPRYETASPLPETPDAQYAASVAAEMFTPEPSLPECSPAIVAPGAAPTMPASFPPTAAAMPATKVPWFSSV